MDKKNNDSFNLEFIKEVAQKMLFLLGLKDFSLVVNEDEKRKIIKIDINLENPTVLIGFRGETLTSFQLILRVLLYKKTGQWLPMVVDVGKWREKREEDLKKIALNMAQKVKFSGESVSLFHLSSWERRIIHLVLANHPEVITQSEGEGKDRKLIIKPKSGSK